MKKLLLGSLIVVLAFALTGWATQTRVLTMGNVNNIVKDDANILIYPHTINMYRNIVVGEFDSDGFYRLGGHYDFGSESCVLGVYLDQTPLGVDAGYWPDGTVDNRLNLFWGRPFGGTDLGLALSLYSDSYVRDGDDADKTEQKEMALGLRLGAGLMEGALDVAAGFMYSNWTNKGTDGEDITTPETNMTIDFGGRYWYEFNDQVYFVPHLGFVYDMAGYTDAADNTVKMNTMALDLGWGVNITPSDDVLFLFDFGINYTSMNYSNDVDMTDTYLTLPYFKVGLEGTVTDWWDVRVGAVKQWISSNIAVTEDISDKYGYADTETYLGSGLHFGPMDLDVQINPQFALKGPNFVSGFDGSLAYMTSLTYNLP